MRDWNPKSLWDELLRVFHGWMDQRERKEKEEGEQAEDPTLLFHLTFTAPLLMGLYAMMILMTRHA